MSWLVLLLAWIMSQGPNQGEGAEQCGGVLTANRGVIQTPDFPRKFSVPIHCLWVIDVSHNANSQDSTIVVYFTQLLVSAGLTFTEFDFYEPDSTFQLGGRLIHRVTEQNVTTVQWLLTRRKYLVMEFSLERLEGNHLRVLDDLLDVYGFNITYETRREVRNSTCSVVGCSLSGNCYASKDFRDYWCSCFDGFVGPDCGQGPLCQDKTLCENGASCRQAGAAAVLCMCPEGFAGSKCEIPLQEDGCAEEEGCNTQCPEDATAEPCSCGLSSTPVTRERARYEGTVRLTNVSAVRNCLESATCSLKPMLTKQITKYLRSSNLTVMEDLRVIDIGFSGEVRFHFWGGKKDGSKVRESLNRLVQRGRLGNVSIVPTHLAITQEPTLQLQSVRLNHPRPVVRQGEEFILSCFAQGSSHMMFRWFKDGIFINITQAKRNMWTRLLPLDSAEQYTALLGIEKSDSLDGGKYTCQVTDWGYQQCKSIALEVLQVPQVKVDPMSLTVEKGENVTVKCTSPNELQYDSKFGYSWTKNNALFKMIPGQEFWEDLYPGGSILRVTNVQKSVTYACHVHGSVKSVSRGARLELLNHTVVPWCPSERGVGGVSWPRAGPGVVGRVDCPLSYSGVVTRLCLLVDQNQAAWQTPDFSDCLSDKMAAISDNFHKLTLGYGNVTGVETLRAVLSAQRHPGLSLPGEGEPTVSLLKRVVGYLEESAAWQDLLNSTDYFYNVVNGLLMHSSSIINHQKVEELQEVVHLWSKLWGSQPGSSSIHLEYDTLVVDLYRYEPGTIRSSVTLSLPRPTISYPSWFPSRASLRLEPLKNSHNLSSSVAVHTYRQLSMFLPQRYSQTLENGSEVQYEVASPMVSVVARGPLRASPEVGVYWTPRVGWELRCGVSQTPSLRWNLTACRTTPQDGNFSLCHCPSPGTYAALLVKTVNLSELPAKPASPRVLLVGCACCLVQSLLTLTLLGLRWWRHKTCLLFLKLQCCFAIAAAMLVFLYATSRSLHQNVYPTVSTALQSSVLVSMSSHLCKALLVYTEVIYLPTIKHLKQTIMCIITGIPLLIVLCNHIAQTSTDTPMSSWWLEKDSMDFYTCLLCGLLITLAFSFLYYQVSTRLRNLPIIKGSDKKKAVSRRQGLLNRAAVVLSAIVMMSTSSTIYINNPTARWQYLFSFCSALLGFVVLLCYALHSESPLHLHLLRTLKLDNSFSSESDSSPLNIAVFTKQEAERECKSVPLSVRSSPLDLCQRTSVPLMNGKAEPVREAPPILKNKSVECFRGPGPRLLGKPKAVTFHNDLVTGCDRGITDQVDMEVYPNSPRKFTPLELDPHGFLTTPPPEGSARVCVITSVVVNTPSVVVCSVDVEPCSVLNQSIVHASVQEITPVRETVTDTTTSTPDESKNDEDVMNRICHDLDYLLGGLSQEMKDISLTDASPLDSASGVSTNSAQQTTL